MGPILRWSKFQYPEVCEFTQETLNSAQPTVTQLSVSHA